MFPLLLLPLLITCCFVPGFFVVRKIRRLTADERICVSIGLSLVILYLIAALIYVSPLNWRWSWLVTGGIAAMTVACWRDLIHFLSKRRVRRRFAAFGALLLVGLMLLALIQHYSGAAWAGDWKEHYDRSLFFLQRQPHNTVFIDLYILPARPPMMHVIAAYFLAHFQSGFDSFQIVSFFLNALVFFPCVMLGGVLVKFGNRRVWLIAAFLVASPVFIQNVTFTWNKLLAAFFVVLSVALYVRGWSKPSAGRVIAAATSMAAGILVHYSAAPFAVFLAIHYLIVFWSRPRKLFEAGVSLAIAVSLLATWFIWSIAVYKTSGTFGSNTTATGTAQLSASQNVHKIAVNLYSSLLPHPLHGSMRQFGVTFAQPNAFGKFRDCYFLFCQQTFPGSLGLLGWAVALYLLARSLRRASRQLRLFWIGLICFVAPLAIATHGVEDQFGVAHVVLQPMTVVGVTLLAVGFPLLNRWLQRMMVLSMAVDLVLGIVLQIRMEMLPIRAIVVRGSALIPLSDGLLNVQATGNSGARFRDSTPFFADHFAGLHGPILIVATGALCLLILRLGTIGARSRRLTPFALVVAIVFLCGAVTCLMDRRCGYRLQDTLPVTSLSDPKEAAAVLDPLLRAAEADPESASAHYALARTFYYMDRVDLLWSELTNAVLLDPEDDRSHFLLGLLQGWYKSPFGKEYHGFDALYNRTYLDDAKSQLTYGQTLFVRGFQKRGLRILADASTRYPGDGQVHAALAAGLYKSGRLNEATAESELAVRLSPNSQEIAELLRSILLAQNRDPAEVELRIRAIQSQARQPPR